MRVLLDTHVSLWWILGASPLSKIAQETVADGANTSIVSAASAWEIATKFRIGKLPGVGDLVARFSGAMQDEGFELLPVTVDHAIRAGSLAGEHKDPFDRMLIAQAQTENIPLISNERVFDFYGVRRIW